ncbi:tRNA lysidine(34) synthetase TilS [Psychroserpens sp.]|uniref:tRNA lysidine(34) synthetase TilS n=1 Tax=Psychroserpens sp. TaxID=2020870 RepID=UPI002B26EC65|nr:tRNA lysidine(34) synthetase TilS [Psychroserpens sp.]
MSFLKESRLLIALSGGLDSVVLTHLCHALKLDITLAHCNFKLRGNESDEDEAFVLELGNKLDLEVFIESFDTETYAKTEKSSIQMAARALRYNWFFDLADSLNFDYILTAHHADDNLETFLINLTRGTGLSGLTGIPEVNENIVRPLLPFTRDQLKTYAFQNNIKWREDSSNASDKYLRNKLRHDVIPILKDLNPQLLQNFKNTQHNLQDVKHIIEDTIVKVQKKVVTVEDDVLKLNIKKLKKLSNPKAYVYQLLKDFNFTEWNDVIDLLNAQSGKHVMSSTHRLIKDRKHLILADRNDFVIPSDSEESFTITEIDEKVQTPFGILFFEEADTVSKSSKETIFVDKDSIVYPLKLRQWKEGDVFYPLGMKGKKKLSKYFKDEKLSIIDKENVWLLTSEDKVVWVIGMRADNRFKIAKNTKHILKVTLQ